MVEPISDSEYDELDKIPIEALNLPESTMRVLRRFGVGSVGDCVFLLEEWGRGMPGTLPHPSILMALVEEVKPKLQELGFWPKREEE